MTDTYKGDNLEIVEKALYCNEHGDTESCENWLTMLRDRLAASAAPAEGQQAVAERAFSEWLDAHRDANVSSVFHEIMARYRAALATAPTKTDRVARIDTLFDAIKHGDDVHREWLREAISAHFDGRTVPPAVSATAPTMSEGAAFGWPWGPREPTTKMLREMAYELNLVPRGEVVCIQFLDILRKQYKAAFNASRPASEPITDAARDVQWRMMVGDWRDETVALHGPNGHIASGLTIDQAKAIIDAHGGERIDRAGAKGGSDEAR